MASGNLAWVFRFHFFCVCDRFTIAFFVFVLYHDTCL